MRNAAPTKSRPSEVRCHSFALWLTEFRSCEVASTKSTRSSRGVSELEDANAELNARAVAAEKALSLLTEQRDRLVSAVVAEDLDDSDAENHPPFLEAEPLELLKEHPDDLQLINGIGPHLEGVLNENGIFTFQQIAQLTTEGVYELDGQLGFKGRIERDEWVRQAGTLHRLKVDGGVDE